MYEPLFEPIESPSIIVKKAGKTARRIPRSADSGQGDQGDEGVDGDVDDKARLRWEECALRLGGA